MCVAMIPASDRHKSCLICLGNKCEAQMASLYLLPTRTKKQRDFCLKVSLLLKAMHPSSEPNPDPERTEGWSVRSAPLAASASKPKSGEKCYSSCSVASSNFSKSSSSSSETDKPSKSHSSSHRKSLKFEVWS